MKKTVAAMNSRKKNQTWKLMKRNWCLYLFLVPAVVFIGIFCYAPMYGVLMAFQDYSPGKGIMGSNWVGLKWFQTFFHLADSEEYTGGEPLFPGGGLPYPHSACAYDKQCKKYQIQKTDTDDNLYAALYFHSNSGRYDVGFPLSQIGVFKSSDCYAGRTG